MMGMTERQQALLTFITGYIAEHGGVAPSFTEMAAHLELSSKSGVHRLLLALQERGLIRRHRHRDRCIEVLHQAPTSQRTPWARADAIVRICEGVLYEEMPERAAVIEKIVAELRKP